MRLFTAQEFLAAAGGPTATDALPRLLAPAPPVREGESGRFRPLLLSLFWFLRPFLCGADLLRGGARLAPPGASTPSGLCRERHFSLLKTMYWPAKYHRGLTRKQTAQRKRSATRRARMSWTNPNAYVPWKTDLGVKTRRSTYSSRFHSKYPDAKTLPEIAMATGIPKSTLQTVYNRGLAAWRTGHRPGASQHAWGMARVHSFVLKGKTYRTADADLAKTSRGKE